MKKFMIGFGIAVLLLVIAGVIYNIWEERAYGPTQAFAMVNTGDVPISVTFQAKKEDGSYEEEYLFDIKIAPKKTVHEHVYQNTYLIKVWDKEGNLVQKLENYQVALSDGKNNTYPMFFDALGKSKYALVNINFLYKAKTSLGEHMSKAHGTKKELPALEKVFSGEKPFAVEKKYQDREFVYPGEKPPEEVAVGSIVYGLIPYPSHHETPEAIWKSILEEVSRY